MAPQNKLLQIGEIVKCGKDPVYFIQKYTKIQHPLKGLIPFDLYPFQEQTLKDFQDNRFNVILKSRQLGVSTLVAAYAAWMIMFHRDKTVLVIATKLDTAMNFVTKVKVVMRNVPKWLMLPTIVGDNKQTIELSHGSKLKAIPTSDDAGRSEALSLLIVDEAAFVKNFDELWAGLFPTLSTGGDAIILSTPNGVGGQYHKLYTDAEAGLNDFNAVKLLWDAHPDRDQEWFANEIKNMTKKQIASELLCDFISSGDTFLSAEDIAWIGQLITPPKDRAGADRNVWIWKYPLTAHKYIISADISRGDSTDYSTFHVIDTDEAEVVAEYKGKMPPDRFAELLFETGKNYANALICPENNSFGYATILKLREMKYPRIYVEARRGAPVADFVPIIDLEETPGFNTNGKTRIQILAKLEEIIRNKQIKIYSSRFYDELKTFMWSGSRPQAMKGHNDDLVISLAIGMWLFDVSASHSKYADKLNDAILNGMGTQSSYMGPFTGQVTGPNKEFSHINPFLPYASSDGTVPVGGTHRKIMTDLDWLFKK